MYINNASLYVEGLVNMASFNIGCSFMKADCYKLDNYIDAFSKDYRISKDIIILKEEKDDIDNFFKEVLNLDKKQTETLTYWLQREAGICNKIYIADNNELYDKLSGYNKGISGFYFVEDVYFIEFENMAVVFIIGNNE